MTLLLIPLLIISERGGLGNALALVTFQLILHVSPGVPQYVVLRLAGVRGAAWWIVASALGLGGGHVIACAVPIPGLGTFGTVGVVSGLVTATAMTWLLGERSSREGVSAAPTDATDGRLGDEDAPVTHVCPDP